MIALPCRPIGDLSVSAVGLGTMTLTQLPDFDSAVAQSAVDAALEAGITLFDTADSYGPTSLMGVNERELARVLGTRMADVVVSTKGGHTRGENATWGLDGTPEYLSRAARASAGRLGLDALPLYHLHRPDPKVEFRASVEALAALCDDGVLVRAGVSNVSVAQLDVARAVLGARLVSVQNELSPMVAGSVDVVRECEAHGIAFLAWGPFGGLRAAQGLSAVAGPFVDVAHEHGVSVHRVVLAWLLALSPVIIPIPGGRRAATIRDSAAAASLELTSSQRDRLDAFVFGATRSDGSVPAGASATHANEPRARG